jgi:diguanylate cyclase (GGDEF)-like protein
MIVQCIQAQLRETDILARYGGDEFIVLLPDSAPHLVRAAAFGVMAVVSDRPVELPGGRAAMATVSVGACLVEPGDTIEMATEMADAALYMAKGEGRNRVMVFDPPDAAEPQQTARQS